MTLGRKPEAIRPPASRPPRPAAARDARPRPARRSGGAGGRGAAAAAPPPSAPASRATDFNRPTDVAWDAAGNIYVADGYGNSRIAKFDKNGKFLKSWGSRGTGAGPVQRRARGSRSTPQGNVYVADRGNKRIQVFDSDGNFKTQFTNVGTPRAICITRGPHQYLYSVELEPAEQHGHDGEIYKMELDGQIVGKFGKAGKLLKEFGTVQRDRLPERERALRRRATNWRVQRVTLKPTAGTK